MANCCKGVSGVLVLLAGILFLLIGLERMAEHSGHMWAGILLGLYGLGLLIHAGNMCPKCRGK